MDETAPLSPSRIERLRPIGYFAASMLLCVVFVAALPRERIGTDFFSFWTAGELIASGQNPYDAGAQVRVQGRLGWDRGAHGGGHYDFMPYYYPPWLGMACVALVPLGYSWAKVAWVSLGIELLLVTGYLLRNAADGVPRWVPVVAVPAFVFSIFSALMGQTVPLILFLIAAAWRLLEGRRDAAAGGVLACLTLKPQLTVVLVAGALLWAASRGRWGVVRGFAVALVLLGLAGALVVPYWPLEMLEAARRHPPPTAFVPSAGATWISVLKTAGLHGWAIGVLYTAGAFPALTAVAAAAVRKDRPSREVLAAGLLAAFFLAPYGRPYDLPVLLLALILAPGGRGAWNGTTTILLILLATTLQVAGLEAAFGDINTVVNELGVTFFWIPLVLAAVWVVSAAKARHADAPGPAPVGLAVGPGPEPA